MSILRDALSLLPLGDRDYRNRQCRKLARRGQAFGYRIAISSAWAASSGVLTLKNGSIGAAGHSAIATPWRAVHTSILRKPSRPARGADRRAAHRPQRRRPDAATRPTARRRAACRLRRAPRAAASPDRAAGTDNRPARSRAIRSPARSPPPSRVRRGCRRAGRQNPARCRRRLAARCRRSAPDRHWH